MKFNNLITPSIIIDLDVIEHNINTYQQGCNENGKELWPMTKTHKSTEIAKMQIDAGATGLLAGTLDECEAFCEMGIEKIMYAYPVASEPNLTRVVNLAKKCNFIIRIDCIEAAKKINAAAKEAGIVIEYTLIVDSGLHRFGVLPEDALEVANEIAKLEHLKIVGISTHPGHVYSATSHAELAKYVEDEEAAMSAAANSLRGAGYELKYVTSGSTPTFKGALTSEVIDILHPGNYVFNDVIQLSTETAGERECALFIYATVVSNPSDGLFLMDAGTKCFGLDQGAHGNSAIVGFGRVEGHPEIVVESLSEEVGKLRVNGETKLAVGDKIKIIPNHSCVPANLTSYLVGIRGEEVERLIEVDIRGNSKKPI